MEDSWNGNILKFQDCVFCFVLLLWAVSASCTSLIKGRDLVILRVLRPSSWMLCAVVQCTITPVSLLCRCLWIFPPGSFSFWLVNLDG